MILQNNSKEVLKLLRHFEYLTEIDKLRLTINLLKSGYLSIKIDKDNMIELLQKFLTLLDPSSRTTLVNFSKYTTLTILSANVMELTQEDRNRVIYEMIGEIYRIFMIP